MRSVLDIVLALAVFTQATSAAALPEGKPEYGMNRWKHHSKGHGATGTGRSNITIANATRPAGPGKTGISITGGTLSPTPIITGDDSTPTDIIVDGNDGTDDDSDDDNEDDSEDDNSGNTDVIKSPSKTTGSSDDSPSFPTLTLPASYKPTGIYNATGSGGFPIGTVSLTKTAAGPTILPSSTADDSDDEVSSSTQLSPSSTTYSPPILPTSEAGEDTVITQTVIPIPASSTKIAVASATSTASSSSGSQWKPAAGATWQIQLHGTVTDTNLPVDIYDIDLIESTPALISSLHANNKKVICYFSAGSFESWRPDAASFTADDKGSPLEGWENEWWLNTNSANVRTIMKARLDLAKSKGCDGVDPDNVDVYSNSNGKGITKANSVDYLHFLSTETRARGMAMGMKNGLDMVTELLGSMDFHVNESCLEYNECDKLVPFIGAGKPVFHIEYPDNAPNIAKAVADDKCKEKADKGFSSLLKNLELDAWVQTC